MNKIKSINSSVEVFGFKISLDSSNALQLISQFDCVVDCTDNVATRYLLNDACYHSQIPLVSGAALRYLQSMAHVYTILNDFIRSLSNQFRLWLIGNINDRNVPCQNVMWMY